MEIIAVLFTLISVYLTIKSNIWCWITGIIGILAYLYIFYTQQLYAQSVLQIVFIVQSIYGWIYWDFNEKIIYNWIEPKKMILHLSTILVLTIILTLFLSKGSDPQPALDILTSLLSILAMWYMSRKIIFHWIIWIITDLFLIIMFSHQNLFWSVALYFVLMVMCVNGLSTWDNSEK